MKLIILFERKTPIQPEQSAEARFRGLESGLVRGSLFAGDIHPAPFRASLDNRVDDLLCVPAVIEAG